MDKKKIFQDRLFWKSALKLAIPVALQNLLISSFSLVDTLMVGQLGDVALSSVGMAGQWVWLMNVFMFGICSGGSIFISQYWGVQDKEGVHRVYGTMLTFSGIICMLFFLIGACAPGLVVRVFNRDPAVVEYGVAYLRIAAFSYPAVILSNVLSTVLRATEKVQLPMYISLVTTILNAFFNYALIFGQFGFPEMGVSGAALATCISSWAGPILLFLISLKQKNILIAPMKKIFSFTRATLRVFFSRAFPVILNESLWGLGTLMYNIMFANLGYEYYAAVTILRTFEAIAFVFFVGFCNACCIMVGKKVGAGELEEAVLDAKRFIILNLIFAISIGLMIVLFRAELVQIFNMGNNISEATLSTATGIMALYGIHLPFFMLPYILIVGVFRSGGDALTGVKYDLCMLWLCAVPLTYLAAFVIKLPFIAVFAVMYGAENYIKVLLCLRHFATRRWIRPVTKEGKAALEHFTFPEKGFLFRKKVSSGGKE